MKQMGSVANVNSGERTRLACYRQSGSDLRRLAAMLSKREKVRDGGGAIASTRGRVRSPA